MQNAKCKTENAKVVLYPSSKHTIQHLAHLPPPLRQKTGRQVKVNRGHNPTQTPNSTYTLFIVVHILISRRNTTQKLCATCLFWYTFRPPTWKSGFSFGCCWPPKLKVSPTSRWSWIRNSENIRSLFGCQVSVIVKSVVQNWLNPSPSLTSKN